MDIISESSVSFKGIDFEEVGLYLSLTINKKELEKENLLDFCPTRSIPGRPPTVTSSGKHTSYEKRWNNWTKPARKATDDVNKKLLMKALEVALKLVMNNHIFTFNKECFKQLSGGAIGVSLAGEVANLFMVWWDRELKARLTSEGIYLPLYSRYVDDGNIAVKYNGEYGNGNELNGLTNKEKEKHIMEKIKNIANSIHESISVKVDYPSNHENKRLPILDTEMWIEQVNVKGVSKPQILYSYYEKEMSSKYVLHKDSAISSIAKINILTNDLVRVMKNTSTQLHKEEQRKNIQHYINRMQFSGYGKEERIRVYTKAKRIFEKTIGNSEVYPHRDKSSRIEDQAGESTRRKKTWYSKGKYKSVFYVDATVNSVLLKKCQQVLNKCDVPIKVVEKTGESLRKMLVRSNPFKDKHCSDPQCAVCLSDSKINCRSRELVYENFCEHFSSCNGSYVGETADPIKERFKEHLDDCRLRPRQSAMHAHAIEKHAGEITNFKVKVRGVCTGDALLRQCMEAVIIRDTKPTMNGREEWGTSSRGNKRLISAKERHNIMTTSNNSDVITTYQNVENIATSPDVK